MPHSLSLSLCGSLCIPTNPQPPSRTARPFQSSLQTCRRRRRHFLLAPAIASALLSLFSHGPSVPPLCSLPCHPRPRLGAPSPSRALLYLELPEAAGDSPREQRDRLGLPCRGEEEAAQGLREEGASGRSRLCITEARTWALQQVRLERGEGRGCGENGGLAWTPGTPRPALASCAPLVGWEMARTRGRKAKRTQGSEATQMRGQGK